MKLKEGFVTYETGNVQFLTSTDKTVFWSDQEQCVRCLFCEIRPEQGELVAVYSICYTVYK